MPSAVVLAFEVKALFPNTNTLIAPPFVTPIAAVCLRSRSPHTTSLPDSRVFIDSDRTERWFGDFSVKEGRKEGRKEGKKEGLKCPFGRFPVSIRPTPRSSLPTLCDVCPLMFPS